MKKTSVVAAVLVAFGGVAQADDGLSANVSLTSKYKYRGQDQSDADRAFVPALQGGFDYVRGGFYIGNWNSGIGFADGTEMDFYGGYRGEAGGIGYDVGLLQYYYPGRGNAPLNTTEVYGALSYGMVTAKLSATVSDDYFGLGNAVQPPGQGEPEGQGTLYADLGLKYPLMDRLAMDAHLGYTRLADDLRDAGYENYADYRLGVAYDLGSGFSLGAAAVGANKKSSWGDVNKSRLVVTLSKSL